MKSDDDIAALLPEPPPVAPAKQKRAIEAALRRFDNPDASETAASGNAAAMPVQLSPRPRQWGLVLSAALVAMIGLPVAWMSVPRESDHTAEPSREGMSVSETNAPAALPEMKIAPDTAPVVIASPNNVAPPTALPAEKTIAPPDILPAPMSPASPPAAVKPLPPAIVVPTELADRRANEEPPGVLSQASRSAPLARDEDADASSIIVTGASRQRVRPTRRGDWNACTVNDPMRSLHGCKSLMDQSRKGAAGQAAAHVADGLAQAWQGNNDRAIAAFDRAIEIDQRSSIAHLNRGLAYGSKGNFDRAIADLDLSIKYAPNEARGYYNRGLLLRQRGDERHAKWDEKRALELDSRYNEAVR